MEADPRVVWTPDEHRMPNWTPGLFLVNGHQPPESSQWWFGYDRSGRLIYNV